MYKGIYIAVSGAILKQKEMDILAQNLANAATIGFKKDSVSFQEYLLPAIGPQPDTRVMSAMGMLATDFSNGNFIQTGNPLDIAVEGDGFIALEGSLFTRRGDMRRDKDGYLVTADGTKVLGGGGPIQLPEGEVRISEDGGISVKGAVVDTISLKKFSDKTVLTKIGSGVFTASATPEQSDARVRQGAIEASNVDVVTEMVRMISAVREFESYQKAIQAFDEATGKVNNDMGRV